VCSVRDIEDILEAEEQEDDRKIKMKAREALKKASAEGKVYIYSCRTRSPTDLQHLCCKAINK